MQLPDFENPSEMLSFIEKQLALPVDPASSAPYPRGLALDLALESAPLAELLEVYSLTPLQMQKILRNPGFRRELEQYKEDLKQDGFSFRQKAKAQAEAYLGTAWKMVHDPSVPSAVKADLIKNTVRWAQLETPPTPGQVQANPLSPEMLESLKSLPDGELEVRVMQILVKRGQAPAALDDSNGLPPLEGDVSEH